MNDTDATAAVKKTIATTAEMNESAVNVTFRLSQDRRPTKASGVVTDYSIEAVDSPDLDGIVRRINNSRPQTLTKTLAEILRRDAKSTWTPRVTSISAEVKTKMEDEVHFVTGIFAFDVEKPQAFMNDTNATAAVKKTLATTAEVNESAVNVTFRLSQDRPSTEASGVVTDYSIKVKNITALYGIV